MQWDVLDEKNNYGVFSRHNRMKRKPKRTNTRHTKIRSIWDSTKAPRCKVLGYHQREPQIDFGVFSLVNGT